DLFFCVRGFKSDGHDFAPEAVERGAVALVCERPLRLGVPEVVVEDSRAAMASVAARFHGDPTRTPQVLGITGPNGKTTTAFLAKGRLFEDPVGPSIVNVDDPYGRRLVAELDEVTTYAIERDADFRARDVEFDPRGSRFTCASPDGDLQLTTGLPGLFNVSNAL